MGMIGGGWHGHEQTAQPPATGDITVTTDAGASWTLTGPSYPGGYSGSGSETLSDLELGDYNLTGFSDHLLGSIAPANDAVTLSEGGHTFNATYAARSQNATITVEVTPDLSQTWTVSSVGFAFSEPGTGDSAGITGPVYVGREYQIVFDAEAGYSHTSPGNWTATEGGSHEFASVYTPLATGDINIAMQDESGQPLVTGLQRVSWTLYKDGAAHLSGDETTAMPLTGQTDGNYFVQWGWARDYWTPHAYEDADTTLAPPRISGTYLGEVGAPNGLPQQVEPGLPAYKVPRTGPTQTMSGGIALTFTGRYQSRSVPALSDLPCGNTINPDWYWQGADTLIDCLQGRSGDGSGSIPLGNRDAHGWPTTLAGIPAGDNAPNTARWLVRFNSPPGSEGLQKFWMFWQGEGTVNVSTLGAVSGGTFALSLGAGQPGSGGQLITLDVGPDSEQQVTGTYRGAVTITVTGAGGNYLRDLELVHESYCGEPPNDLPSETTDDFRSQTVTTEAKWFLDYNRIARFLTYNDSIEVWNVAEVAATPQPGDPILIDKVDYAGPGRQLDDFNIQYFYDGANWGTIEIPHTYRDVIQQKIDIANAGNCDLWMVLHPFKTPAMWDAIIDMIEAPYVANKSQWEASGLKPGLAVYWEYNEVWFDIFPYGEYFRFWSQYYIGAATDQLGRSWASIQAPFTPIADPPQGIGTPIQGYAGVSSLSTAAIYKTHCYHLWLLGETVRANTLYQSKGYTALQDRYRLLLGIQTVQDATYPALGFLVGDSPFGGPYDPADIVSFDGSTMCIENFYGCSGTNYLASGSMYPDVNGIDVSNPANHLAGAYEWSDLNKARIVAGSAPQAEKPNWAQQKTFMDWLPSRVTDGGRLTLCGYEGGNGDTPGDIPPGPNADWVTYLRHMHQHYSLHKYLYFHFRDAGYGEACHYSAPTAWPDLAQGGLVGSFGIKSSMHMSDAEAYRWQAFVDFAHEYPADW